MGKLRGSDFVSIKDFSPKDLQKIIVFSLDLKKKEKAGEKTKILQGKSLALVFEKPSTRTRISFEVGMYQLWGHAVVLEGAFEREDVKDVAKTLSRYVDGIVIRTFGHEKVIKLAEAATVPVINGLSDLLHPCQAMADVLTMFEQKGDVSKLTVAYVGDGNNVCNSLINAADVFNFKLKLAIPEGYDPKVTSKNASIVRDPAEAVKGADVVYADVWASMGQEKEKEKRKKIFAPYQVNAKLMKAAKPDAIFLHCLPAHRGEEVMPEVIDGPQSKVFDQAENRLHVQKAILALLLAA
ncbi:MAG: ornithine carbamoyltransferase [Candidatus Margulisbacteria bacterium]|nr:ornithine carbamoyltransferase [Candidatus Margulisiibacteriota bacterium]MBU1022471.1 ornithine carbamoyltransferase [Candidatus Margulisiibacteriota bacterium]MBU1728455.1 ornithine carbamoyltransferase [Candidatus Margulisiibacteriota bacterium]MBU1954602.1 ornithine carbamoyltransferase [Candidatus Margulisiibacteriota bacterium]